MNNDRMAELEQLRSEYNAIQPPEGGLSQVRRRMKKARRAARHPSAPARWGIGVAAALAVLAAVPNLSPAAAAALGRVPGLGAVVRVVTLSRYQYADATHDADVKTPALEENAEAAGAVNAEAKAYTEQLLDRFRADVERDSGSYQALKVDYDVVTDTADWFTLRISGEQIAAGGYAFVRCYNIDKTTGQVVRLEDLFRPGADYVTAISEDIKKQMRARMAADPELTYFIDSEEDPEMDFQSILTDQPFCRDEKGNLVILFDEYEVAPGSMGRQEFTIDSAAVADILKERPAAAESASQGLPAR